LIIGSAVYWTLPVLVCLAKSAASYDTFSRMDRFLINVLSEEHSDTARHFATSAPDKFAHTAMRPCELGLPGLPDASARLACHTNSVLDGGDHSILIGQVEATAVSSHTSLTYYQRQFGIARPHAFQVACPTRSSTRSCASPTS